jgi:phage tail-like protein
MSPTSDPFLGGNFKVEISGIPTATSFSEVSGLEAVIEVVDYRAGNAAPGATEKQPGQSKYTNITLKRGVSSDLSLWNWMSNALKGSVQRAAVSITLLDQADNPQLRWNLANAWPCRWTGPVLVADSSEVAIETLEIAYEGLEVVAAG